MYVSFVAPFDAVIIYIFVSSNNASFNAWNDETHSVVSATTLMSVPGETGRYIWREASTLPG